MNNLNVLHLASFDGNIGDNANHAGTRKMISHNISHVFNYNNLEIREFFWGERKFDQDFVSLANSFDLVIIGGGNYFELWVENSSTGTSIDISIDMLKQISSPILFYGLGCDPYKGAPINNIHKFKNFLDYTLASSKYILSVRNDGSLKNIEEYFGTKYKEKIYKVPDGGFFITTNRHMHPEIPTNKTVIGINLAGDMPDLRFNKNISALNIDCEEFVFEFASFLNDLLSNENSLHIVFYPHIYKDVEIISKVLNNVKDEFRRLRITVAPYLHGPNSFDYIFDSYQSCSLILGMRFHANVCGIALNIPTLGLISYPKLDDLYSEISMSDLSIWVNNKNYTKQLTKMIYYALNNQNDIKNRYKVLMKNLSVEAQNFHKIIDEWVTSWL